MEQLLVFRIKQIQRLLQHAGLWYLLFVLVVAFGVVIGAINAVLHSESASFGLLGLLLVGNLHFSRKDTGFLQQIQINRPKLYCAEYLLLTVPIALAFLIGGNWGALGIQTLGIILLSFVPVVNFAGKNWQNRLKLSFIPLVAFELKSFLRQYFLIGVATYVLALGLSYFVAAALVFAIVLAASWAPLFDEVEGKDLFELFDEKGGILRAKLRIYLSLYLVLLIPHIALFLILHGVYWYLLLAAIFLGMTIIVFNIVYKYAHYSSYRRRIYNSMVNSVFLLATLVPFFYPITLLYLLWYWRKAQKNIASLNHSNPKH